MTARTALDTYVLPPAVETPKEKIKAKQGSIVRYKVDFISIAVVMATVSLQFFAYLQGTGWWFMLPLVLLGVRQLHLIEHNHVHLSIFRQKFLNETIGYLFYLSNGVAVEVYDLHHVRNHHRYSQQWDGTNNDWSSTFGFKDTKYPHKPVSRWYYSVTFPLLALMHTLIEFLRNPGTPIFWSFLRSNVVFFAANAVMIYFNPLSWLLFFGLPILLVWGSLGNNNYTHHAGCDMETPHSSANVNLRFLYRHFGFNIGYHVAHHLKPTLHWSQLPKFHATHENQIPEKNVILPRSKRKKG